MQMGLHSQRKTIWPPREIHQQAARQNRREYTRAQKTKMGRITRKRKRKRSSGGRSRRIADVLDHDTQDYQSSRQAAPQTAVVRAEVLPRTLLGSCVATHNPRASLRDISRCWPATGQEELRPFPIAHTDITETAECSGGARGGGEG